MQTLLHVGSGPRNPAKVPKMYDLSQWQEVRLDIDPNVQPDIIGDIRDMVDVDSGSFDALYSSHNIEHLFPHEVSQALGEFHRVLKPGGHALITCPDLQSIAACITEGNLADPIYTSPAGPITPLDVLYGHRPSLARGNTFMAHKTGFTAQTLAQAMHEAGFTNIRVQRRDKPNFDLWAQGFRAPENE